MIIYGVKAKQLAKESLFDKCPSCGTQNSVDMYVFQKYAHIFWVPFFPLAKTGVSQCNHCKQALKVKEMPASLRAGYENARARTKTPIWMFTFTALIVALIAFVSYDISQDNKRNAKFVESPQRGDVYEIRQSSDSYTLFKVEEVTNDSVFVVMNQYESNRSSGLGEIKRKGDDGYLDFIVAYSRKEVKDMLKNGKITNVVR